MDPLQIMTLAEIHIADLQREAQRSRRRRYRRAAPLRSWLRSRRPVV